MVTYPLSYPTAPGPQKLVLSATNTIGMSKSPFTGQQQTYQWPSEFFSLDVSLPPMLQATAQAWVAFLVALRGQLGTFYAGDSSVLEPAGVATGTPLVSGAQTAMSTSLTTKGWTAGVSNILLAGDYIQLGTGVQQRLYKVLTNATSDGSGHATLDIFPRLREGVSDAQPITTINCMGTFRLSSNERKWTVEEIQLYGVDFSAEEAF